MDTSWSNFLFQVSEAGAGERRTGAPGGQGGCCGGLQAGGGGVSAGSRSGQTPPPPPPSSPSSSPPNPSLCPPEEPLVSPPSTVDTAALSEEPLPVKVLVKPAHRAAHVCSTCNKEFKNSYNLRRHQSVHTGVKMKDRAAREKDDGVKGHKQTVPLSLLQLTLPSHTQAPPTVSVAMDTVSVSIAPATVSIAPATVSMAVPPQPIQAAVVVVGSVDQSVAPPPSAPPIRPEEPRVRGVREGVSRRVPPEPAPSVALGREAVLVPDLPTAIQTQRPNELPRPLAPGRRREALRVPALRQGLLTARSSEQPREAGALHRETLQMHRLEQLLFCPMCFTPSAEMICPKNFTAHLPNSHFDTCLFCSLQNCKHAGVVLLLCRSPEKDVVYMADNPIQPLL
ncbi:uncharacterized protein C6orf132 homolog [Boleophthalmus pectinirostris]|uniref:uncharacterized protein C6orf132 homolog n=1 Tax=Boleophthalmus pectinirostris TaxID=150288 RepID=UPI00242D5E2E|nr:uncharacterized protein C6orf132 homolog [Boleophthalmus pectinirostris]